MKRKKKRELPKYLFVNLVSGERDPPSMPFRETTQSLTIKNSNSHFQELTILMSHSDLNRTLSKPFWKPQNPPILHLFHSFTFIHFPTTVPIPLEKTKQPPAGSVQSSIPEAASCSPIVTPSWTRSHNTDSFFQPSTSDSSEASTSFWHWWMFIRFFPHFKHNNDKLCRGYGFTSVLTIENYSTSDNIHCKTHANPRMPIRRLQWIEDWSRR